MLERLQEARGERGYLILYDIACVLERHLRIYIATASSVLSMIACICAHIHTAYRNAHAAELLTMYRIEDDWSCLRGLRLEFQYFMYMAMVHLVRLVYTYLNKGIVMHGIYG